MKNTEVVMINQSRPSGILFKLSLEWICSHILLGNQYPFHLLVNDCGNMYALTYTNIDCDHIKHRGFKMGGRYFVCVTDFYLHVSCVYTKSYIQQHQRRILKLSIVPVPSGKSNSSFKSLLSSPIISICQKLKGTYVNVVFSRMCALIISDLFQFSEFRMIPLKKKAFIVPLTSIMMNNLLVVMIS